jgi:hypothetical protein
MERASEVALGGLVTSLESLKRVGGGLEVGYHLTLRLQDGVWYFKGEAELQVWMWDKDEKPIGGPIVRSIPIPAEFAEAKMESYSVKFRVDCPPEAHWISVQFEEGPLQTKKVKIPK